MIALPWTWMVWLVASTVALVAGALHLSVASPARDRGIGLLQLLLLAAALWCGAAVAELGSPDVATKLMWGRVQYIGMVVMPPLWLAFALKQTDQWNSVPPLLAGLYLAPPAVCLAVAWTPMSIPWIWATATLDTTGAIPMLATTKGLALKLFIAHAWVSFALTTGIFIYYREHVLAAEVEDLVVLCFAGAAPLAANFGEMLGWQPIPHMDLEPFTLIGPAIASIIYVHRFDAAHQLARAHSAVVETMEDPVILVTADGRVHELNEAARTLLIVPQADAIGLPIRELIGSDLLALGRGAVEIDRGGRRLEADLLPFRAPNVHAVVLRDVTRFRVLQDHVQRSHRLASLGTMSAGMAHEINSPLTYVMHNLSYMERILEDDEAFDLDEFRSCLEDAAIGARRIRNLTDDMTSFVRIDDSAVGDVEQAVHRSLKLATPSLREHDITIELTRLPKVALPTGSIEQIVVNLLVNAGHALEGRQGRIEVSGKFDGEQVVLSIRDNGNGLDPELIERIFDPFFTTKGVDSGTGLGLFVCRGLVEAAGGSMSAGASPSGGAEFLLKIPIAGAAPTAERARLLILDDDPVALKYLSSILEAVDVRCTSNPREALQMARDERFDGVLCDVFMPDMDGTEFYDELSAITPSLMGRVTFMTGGRLTAALESRLQELGAAVLLKPLDARKVRAVVASLCG